MKNKFLLIIILNILFCILFSNDANNTDYINDGQYIISIKNSEVEWVGKKLSSQHSGLINIDWGHVVIKNNKIYSADIVIDMQSIIVTDIEPDKGGLSLANHLKDPDFFNVDLYPTAKFLIKDYKPQDLNKRDENNICYLKGDLKILDIIKPYTIQIKLYPEKEYIRVIGKMEIDRTDFNITYGSGSYFDIAADRAISNIFDLNFKLIAIKDTITQN